jgi:nucleotide-binding universal stress UspA family protein
MTPQAILAVTDFSASGDRALSRAAHLCAEQGATLKLLSISYPGEPPPPDATCRLAHHALQLGQRHGIYVRSAHRIAFTVDDILAEARCADLLVWGASRARNICSFFLGQPVDALLRRARRPVLIVRRAVNEAYRRLLIAVDFSEASHRLVEVGFAIGKSAQVELFHAVSIANEGKLRYAEVSEHAIKTYREACLRYAQDRMFWLTDSYNSRRHRVLSALGRGEPARQTAVQQQHSGAELIIVGKHPASLLTDILFESTAKRVLRHAHTDVLVVPDDYEAASSGVAAKRLAREQPAANRIRAGAPPPPGQPNPAAVLGRT